MPVLVAPTAFCNDLRAPVVAAAIGRGLERAGCPPPDLCPLSGGGPGTIELLLPVLGGETGDGFALIEDGATALAEPAGDDGAATGERLAAAAATGAAVVMLAAARTELGSAGALLEALGDHGGLRGAALVVLCDLRDPGAPALALRDERGARLVAGVPFVLEALDFDARMRAAHALVVGEGRLDRGTLRGRVTGEIATRARQGGVPCHAVVGVDAIERFDARILDLQAIIAAATIAELEAAGEALAAYL
ncbi:MAG TPA: glycerate kinase [Solirubrobacteraceae bacterium]|nr:glycerate kinase [Solirubrobacteraceae bacterium]